tara:strand:+ start:1003 stop:1446 length:444 start_codon:yes stop_codon:yes gene_type:complete
MPIGTSAVCTSFKQELLVGTHNFTNGADAFKLALYTNSATISASSTVYVTLGETTNDAGSAYSAGGNTLVNVTPTTSGTTAYCDFSDTSWSTASFTAYGALIYNSTDSNKAVCVLNFGGDKTSSAGTFTIQFPADDASNAILRLETP